MKDLGSERSRKTGAGAPEKSPPPTANGAFPERWNQRAARILRKECRLYGDNLAIALRWWKRCREKGKGRGIGDAELEAAVIGLRHVMRVRYPVEPHRLFCHKNSALFQDAMSAGFKAQRRQPQRIGAVLKHLVREA